VQDRAEGFGVFVMRNGSRYEGEFRNSLKHGMGTERFGNGETYVGNYERNRPNGEGEYYWCNGDYYKGGFSNGLRHGQGCFREGTTGVEYHGQYHNDKKCGFGHIHYQHGLAYAGNFENNLRHGYGELLEQGQLQYRGYWVNDLQVDDANHAPLQHEQTIQITRPGEYLVLETLPLPKGLPRQPKGKERERRRSARNEDGYKRACGCNRKH
jgi:hypothetical protein